MYKTNVNNVNKLQRKIMFKNYIYLKIMFKITEVDINVVGQGRQKVLMAAKLFFPNNSSSY